MASDVETRLVRLERILISGRGARPVGGKWRLDARPWPASKDDECLIMQAWKKDGWVDVLIFKPDGTIQPA